MNQVGEIYFFGSLQDGFKVYPDTGMTSKTFAGYYNNTEKDWVLDAKKTDKGSVYTYVRYGLLTSMTNGRHGSCIGFSIEFFGCYFSDFAKLRVEIFEAVFDNLVKESHLIGVHPSGMIAFLSYDLNQVKQYLDNKTQIMRDVISAKYSEYLRAAAEISKPRGNMVMALHPNSNPIAIFEIFQSGGAIKISPQYPVENRSVVERLNERNQELEERIKEKDGLLNYWRGIGEKAEKEKTELRNQNDKLKNENNALNQVLQASQHQSNKPEKRQEEIKGEQSTEPPSSQVKGKQPYTLPKLNPKQKALIVCIIVFALISTWFLAPCNNDTPDRTSHRPTNPAFSSEEHSPKRVQSFSVEPIAFAPDKNGKMRSYLSEHDFLIHNEGKIIRSEEDLKELITSFLLRNSPVTRDTFDGSKKNLWVNIKKENPNSISKIKEHIQKNQRFEIKNTSDLQELFKDILIY